MRRQRDSLVRGAQQPMRRVRLEICMRRRKPRTLWDELRVMLGGRPHDDDDEGEQAEDPALLFHALFTVPLLIALVAAFQRLVSR
jgi:hypothetical protein